MNEFERDDQTFVTSDLEFLNKFTYFDGNRDVVQSRINEFMDSIVKRGFMGVVLVYATPMGFKVLDGQNRLEAFKQLISSGALVDDLERPLKLHFQVVENYHWRDVPYLNFTQKNWQDENFLKWMMAESEQEEIKQSYQRYYDFFVSDENRILGNRKFFSFEVINRIIGVPSSDFKEGYVRMTSKDIRKLHDYLKRVKSLEVIGDGIHLWSKFQKVMIEFIEKFPMKLNDFKKFAKYLRDNKDKLFREDDYDEIGNSNFGGYRRRVEGLHKEFIDG